MYNCIYIHTYINSILINFLRLNILTKFYDQRKHLTIPFEILRKFHYKFVQ